MNKINFNQRYRIPTIVGVSALLIFLLICIGVKTANVVDGVGPIYNFDWPIEWWFTSIRIPFITQKWAIPLASLIYYPELLALAVVICSFANIRRLFWAFLIDFAVCEILNMLLKSFFARPRPFNVSSFAGMNVVPETNYSFPSGHSMLVMAFFGFIVWLVWNYAVENKYRRFWAVMVSLFIVATGASRVYLGVHFTTDVIGGFCVSLVWLCIFCTLIVPHIIGEPPLWKLKAAQAGDAEKV